MKLGRCHQPVTDPSESRPSRCAVAPRCNNRDVTVPPFDLTRLPGEWWEVEASESVKLEQALRCEVPIGHLLHGVSAQAVAVRRQLKDVVFWLPTVRQWAVVHLTGRAESNPHWPSAFCAPRWDAVVAELAE